MAQSYTLKNLGISVSFLEKEFASLNMIDLAKKLKVSYQSLWYWCKKLDVDYRATEGYRIGVAKSQAGKDKWAAINGQPGAHRKNTRHTEATKKKISESKKGDAYIDGKKVKAVGRKYPTEFYAIRLEVYKRDRYLCQECGVHCNGSANKDVKRQISCHHIDYDKNNNGLSNLITLCKSCHSKTNYSRADWTKYYKERVSK